MNAKEFTKFRVTCAAALLFTGATVEGQVITLTNPGFGDGFPPGGVVHGYDNPGFDVPGWSDRAGGANTDSGVIDLGDPTAYPNPPLAYQKTGDSNGGIQVTAHTIVPGESYRLTWDATQLLGGTSSQSVYLFRVDNPALANFLELGSSTATIGPTLQSYTLNYTAAPGDAGKLLGVGFRPGNSGYAGYDNFALTVVPEPSTWAFACSLSLGGFAVIQRLRRRRV